MKVLFNTEGNKFIGMGAFYDCTILAEKFRERFNAKIKFLISHDSEKVVKSVLLNGYDVERVDMRETEKFLNSVKEFKPDVVVQNLLNLKEDYMEGLNKLKVKIVDISHKMVATRAGLGWIGKADLFISSRFGPRLRLVSILINKKPFIFISNKYFGKMP